ncbi:MAG: agmatine deiminase family protein [Bacteroidetes bacterium]|nr:agmatine deiminase family protein [Bacteroidota bacterium]
MYKSFRMPAEWSSHNGTELHWPHNIDTWPGERLERVRTVYLNIIKALEGYDQVHLFINDEETQHQVKNLLKLHGISDGGVTFHLKRTNDTWARDCGPIFVSNDEGQFAITNWDYNSWGEKYPPFNDDNKIPDYIAQNYTITQFKPGIVLEGGSIDVNGEGVLLTTESVLLNPNRNPHLNKAHIESILCEYLGIKKIIWLKKGLAGDDTDGHIDDLSRFVKPSTIMTMVTEDESDVNYVALQENLEILKHAKNLDGSSFSIIEIPMPLTKIEGTTVDGSEFVPASYANFYIANDVVLLPFYDKRYDEMVREQFESFFPNRKIVGIPCADLVYGQGSIHCITQQLYI